VSEQVDLQEFIGAFVVEAEDLVILANASLLEIEVAIAGGTSRPRAVRDLSRALHTLKGLAGMIGVEPIVAIAHALETLVRAADRSGGNLRHAAAEIALQGVAAISDRVQAVAEHRVVAEPPDGLIAAIASTEVLAAAPIMTAAIPTEWEARLSSSECQQLALALQSRAPVWTLAFCPSEANAARGITITTVRAGLGAIGEIVKIVPRSITATDGKPGVAFDIVIVSNATQLAIAEIASTDPGQVIAMAQPAPPPVRAGRELEVTDALAPIEQDQPGSTPGRAVVRVELARLDDLQDQLSLLIVSRFRLEHEIASLAELGHDVRRLQEVVRIQGRQLRDLRRAILRARMVRVAEVLEPLPLLVRSLARSGQRLVQLEIEARDAELDKAVADRLLPALIHLVRNAVDHGIEPPEQRVAAGKPRMGTVAVSCLEVAGNYIEVVVRDDGRGIDRAEVARRANRPIADDAALLAVLTSPGFSTRDVATTTSGRGLGMDIVRRIAVDELGGELSMTTHPDAGTSFTLRAPVTMSVMDVLSFQCGSQAFVVPALVVEEIIEVVPAISSSSLVACRGHAIPMVSLGAILAIDSGARARKALVVRRNGAAIAFAVDRVIGRQEVVIRTVDDPLVNVPGIAGTTDLGDGHPTLVLDLNELGIIARERSVSS
jgi:two-component system, chemotaxis family, sensor kinase CheA